MRERKFRQAAFVYLHVGILYEGAAWQMWRQGLLPERMGPGWIWMLAGAAITALVFVGLWYWQNVWLARIIWAIGALRVPTLIGGAFFPTADQRLGPSFYGTALVVVMINLWMLARAGWDL
ncbi:MAG: hypothetical protein V3T16_05435 [Gemmatimonadales bacterium]